MWWHIDAVVSTVPHSKKIPGSSLQAEWRPLFLEFACFPCVLVTLWPAQGVPCLRLVPASPWPLMDKRYSGIWTDGSMDIVKYLLMNVYCIMWNKCYRIYLIDSILVAAIRCRNSFFFLRGNIKTLYKPSIFSFSFLKLLLFLVKADMILDITHIMPQYLFEGTR